MSQPLPKLTVADFGPGRDHVAESYHGGKVFAIMHRNDRARMFLPFVQVDPLDPFHYAVIHGGAEVTQFEDNELPQFEIPVHVVAELLVNEFGAAIVSMSIRLVTCYGHLFRTGDGGTLAEKLGRKLPAGVQLEASIGTVSLLHVPPYFRFGETVVWDDSLRLACTTGQPGDWKPVVP